MLGSIANIPGRDSLLWLFHTSWEHIDPQSTPAKCCSIDLHNTCAVMVGITLISQVKYVDVAFELQSFMEVAQYMYLGVAIIIAGVNV